MLKRKTALFFSAALFIFISFPLFCKEKTEIEISADFTLVPQSLCGVNDIQADFLFFPKNAFRFGPLLFAGWSSSYYNQNNSKAFIFGYTTGAGIKFQYRILPSLYADADARASIIYATFPTILWADVDAGITYYFEDKSFLRFEGGILFTDSSFKFKGSAAWGISF